LAPHFSNEQLGKVTSDLIPRSPRLASIEACYYLGQTPLHLCTLCTLHLAMALADHVISAQGRNTGRQTDKQTGSNVTATSIVTVPAFQHSSVLTNDGGTSSRAGLVDYSSIAVWVRAVANNRARSTRNSWTLAGRGKATLGVRPSDVPSACARPAL
jgi:hypothetical protein